ncbi:MAG TPA: nucleotidyltransferase domain-containing protein [Flavisolibacter sp.]|nr:nucleotidyltransferase domain-containing protein [Flavisolibacter sp.]
MKRLTIDTIKEDGWLVFEAVTGSKAYGLDTPTSDTDIRGVYVVPKSIYYSLGYPEQVSNESNDIVYYELRRFMELLSKNNPNIMEMLGVPEHCVLHRHEVMKRLEAELFLSKLCQKTFANYAFTQIKKAYGLEKKIVNPVEKERKSVIDFCFVYIDKDALPARHFLTEHNMKEENVGLSAIPHLRDCYNLFYAEGVGYAGVVRKETSNEVALSSIPKGEAPVAMLYFNRDGYSVYCKKYKEYWEWVEKRNEERYKTTMSHGKNYDSKNMMHVFRLLLMAKEIASEKRVNVFRNDRPFLLDIKAGKFEYDELVAKAEELKNELPGLYAHSDLPDEPDLDKINSMLVQMRKQVYSEQMLNSITER